MKARDEFIVERLFKDLIENVNDMNKYESHPKEYLKTRIPEIGDSIDVLIDNLKIFKEVLITNWSKDAGLLSSITVDEGEWFYYAEAKDTPVCIIKNKMFRYIEGRILKQSLNNSWRVTPIDDGNRYIVSHRTLPLFSMKKEN